MDSPDHSSLPEGRLADAGAEGRPRSAGLPRSVLIGLAAALAAAVALGFLFFHHKRKGDGAGAISATVRTAAPGTVRLKGMTAAVGARAVEAPLIAGQQVGTLTIVKMIPGGTRVKKGDLLVEFDRQAQLRD